MTAGHAHHLVGLIRQRRRVGPKQPSYVALHRVADQAVPGVRATFRAAIAEAKKSTIVAKLEAALAHRSHAAALDAVAWRSVGSLILQRRMGDRMQALILRAGMAAQQHQPLGLHLRLGRRLDDKESLLAPAQNILTAFDAKNPHAIKAAVDQSAKLVTGISDQTQQAIADAIARAIAEGRPPRVAAKDIRDMIGLNALQQRAIDGMRAAGASDTELVTATRQALDYRAEMVARTETMRASNLGQEALWDTAEDSGLIDAATATREWVATPDERECPVCADLDGQTFALGEAIQTDYGDFDTPPIHPNCRCVLVLNVAG